MVTKAPSLILTATLLLMTPSPAASAEPDRSEQWRQIAVTALQSAEAAPAPTSFRVFANGGLLRAYGGLYGWDHPRVPELIGAIMADRNPDGGWGIGEARDYFADGTVNPADTTYTVTIADHVGGPLLDAHLGGALDDPEPIQTIVYLLTTTPRIDTAAGSCLAYSRRANDAKPGWCVHNVNAGAAAFLQRAAAAGYARRGSAMLVATITQREVSAWLPAYAAWKYSDAAGKVQDPDHGSYSAASLHALAYPIGREAAYKLMVTTGADDNLRRAHLRLPGLGGIMCQLGDAHLDEARAYVAAAAGDRMRLAQAAQLATANARECTG
jgi:hypothetical protein